MIIEIMYNIFNKIFSRRKQDGYKQDQCHENIGFIPVEKELDLKKAASSAKEKKVERYNC
ncbi:MAG: hypothetical protein ABRQ27_05220 [Clostridiaceae bacterium]